MKRPEFHQPFIRSLVFIGVITICTMMITRLIVSSALASGIQQVLFTINKS